MPSLHATNLRSRGQISWFQSLGTPLFSLLAFEKPARVVCHNLVYGFAGNAKRFQPWQQLPRNEQVAVRVVAAALLLHFAADDAQGHGPVVGEDDAVAVPGIYQALRRRYGAGGAGIRVPVSWHKSVACQVLQ